MFWSAILTLHALSAELEPDTWTPGPHLNIEKVFRNFQYYEIALDEGGKGIAVTRYICGSQAGSEKYRLLPDGSLQKGNPRFPINTFQIMGIRP